MTYLDQLKADQSAIAEILQARKAQTPEQLRPGVIIVHRIYIQILEDAISILNSLITFMSHET